MNKRLTQKKIRQMRDNDVKIPPEKERNEKKKKTSGCTTHWVYAEFRFCFVLSDDLSLCKVE